MKPTFLSAALAVLIFSGAADAAVYTSIPIAAGFYTTDVIQDATTPIGGNTTTAAFAEFRFFENGIANSTGGTRSDGLPVVGGAISHSFGGNSFSYAVAVAGNNIRTIAGVGTATATLATPGIYSSISVLIGGSFSPSPNSGGYTLNYSDGSSSVGTLSVRDWITTDTGAQAFNVGLSPKNATAWDGTIFSVAGVSFDSLMIAADPTKTLQSITFDNAAGTRGIMGIAGVLVPEPSVALLGGLGFLALLKRRRA